MKINKNRQYVNNMKKIRPTVLLKQDVWIKKNSTFVSEISHESMNSSQSKDNNILFQFISIIWQMWNRNIYIYVLQNL